jgi:apolipoprotein N-acyltransferase
VAFGEFLPLANWFPFLRDWLPIPGDFTPGNGPVLFDLGTLGVRITPLICFEDVFPHLVRKQVNVGTDILLNLTNNGWFGESAAQWQHAAAAVFRAVETRRPLVRCTNNGLTCWIDERGVMREVFGRSGSDVYKPGFLSFRLPLRTKGSPPGQTFYVQHGDVFGWACLVAGLSVVFARVRRGKRLARGHSGSPN